MFWAVLTVNRNPLKGFFPPQRALRINSTLPLRRSAIHSICPPGSNVPSVTLPVVSAPSTWSAMSDMPANSKTLRKSVVLAVAILPSAATVLTGPLNRVLPPNF